MKNYTITTSFIQASIDFIRKNVPLKFGSFLEESSAWRFVNMSFLEESASHDVIGVPGCCHVAAVV